MAQRVNLDAMISRADLQIQGPDAAAQQFGDFPIRNLEEDNPVRRLLRKPDFQRETNHWSPEQLATFLGSFLDNELIPSIILWKSSIHIFVIDGGHRLSALRAWMEDDYGDGPISIKFYSGEISAQQKHAAKAARVLVERHIGRFTTLRSLVGAIDADPKQISRATNLFTRALNLQWVVGNVDVAESSFFKINSQGTPLDDVEEMLLKNRHKGLAIAARAIVRAGAGHKYWSAFTNSTQRQIERAAEEFHQLLFDPEIKLPVRSLDLPLGGSVSPVDALALLIDFLAIASSRQLPTRNIESDPVDKDGSDTLACLQLAKVVAMRIVGNDSPSLGLHPAVYFYNERGVHSRHLFLGVARLITDKIRNNDSVWFEKFTKVRADLEKYLIENKAVINQLFTNMNRNARVLKARDMLNALVTTLSAGKRFGNEELFESVGATGTILDIQRTPSRSTFTKETKSQVFLQEALTKTPKCPFCGGLLFPVKSISYDHKTPLSAGGASTAANAQLMHPYCNSVKGSQML